MLIWWGRDLVQIYNDAYAEVMGADLNAHALGQPGRECWAEIWDTIGRGADRVLAGGSDVTAGKQGFGTTLIERVASDLGGSAVLNFLPTGLVATTR
jgi:hypothetical protein